MKKIFSLITRCMLATLAASGQELNCNVSVLSPQIQSSDKKVFTTLQTAIYEFMNNTRWTN
ncbi:MAG: DUF4835 family protein, partial [Bacteroidota bacterium]